MPPLPEDEALARLHGYRSLWTHNPQLPETDYEGLETVLDNTELWLREIYTTQREGPLRDQAVNVKLVKVQWELHQVSAGARVEGV